MESRNVAQKVIAGKTVHIMAVDVDFAGSHYVAYTLMRGDMLDKFLADSKDGKKVRLEDYGIVDCTIPKVAADEKLENIIKAKIERTYFKQN